MKQGYQLNYKIVGKGPVIVMLHGLAGTSQYFDRITKYLPDHQIVSIDLLGFGKSPKPKNIQYTIQDHVESIHSTLEAIKVRAPFIILGISMGALLALEYTKSYPKNISKTVLVSPTIYSSSLVAKRKIDETRAPNILLFGPVAKFVCNNICSRPKLAQKINPVVMRHIPKDVAKTVCEHSWESYSRSMQNVVINQPKQNVSNILDIPLCIIYDNKDTLIEQDYIKDIAKQSRRSKIANVGGGHGMLVNNTSIVAESLSRLL